MPRRWLRRQTLTVLVGSVRGLVACGSGASGDASPIGGSPATAREFAALLPLSLTLADYARIERIADPPKSSAGAAPRAVPLKTGDLAYYAPWGNLAIFVEDGTGNYTGDLMRLGAVEAGPPALQRPGSTVPGSI